MSNNLELLRNQKPSFLGIAKDKKSYICPSCQSGTGAKGSGMTTKDKVHYKCWSCGLYGDIIDLFKIKHNITDDREGFKECFKYFGIDEGIEKSTPQQMEYYNAIKEIEKSVETSSSNNDFKYLLSRGISEKTQRHFKIGYVENWRSPTGMRNLISTGKNPLNLPTSPRCIIPRNNSYLARDIRKDISEHEKKFEKQNEGSFNGDLFNINVIDQSEVIFIVEGEIDAMSIFECGENAVGLCSTSNTKTLLNYIRSNRKDQKFILMLDNDDTGRKATKELQKGLNELEMEYLIAEYPSSDPNDYLRKNPNEMRNLISSLKVKILKDNKFNASDLLDYFRNIETQETGLEIKTGFPSLDDENRNLYGGLHEGLYILGAISSLGKTTFTLQLADQIAEGGQDVIFFSLEQSKYELVSKSISRYTYIDNRDKKVNGSFIAKETNQILNSRKYTSYCDEERKVISEAIEKYSEGAKHLYIHEGKYKGERLTVHHIRQVVKKHIETTGRTPVIFIDYLQILGTSNDFRGTDKQATDEAVTELKDISRDFKTVVFVISSFNRENYNNGVSMTSFKESGAIEYSSDILFGLQYEGMTRLSEEKEAEYQRRIAKIKSDIEEAKNKKQPIRVELKCLKNRNGNTFTISFFFNGAFNFYEELNTNFKNFEETKKAKKRL